MTTDVAAVHRSKGHFGEAWQRQAERFVAKFPELRGPQGPNYVPAAHVADRAALVRFYDTLRALAGTV